MIQLFRNFFRSKIGLGITFAFLALIALAFASMDVAGNATFGGVSGGDRVAVVGDTRIGTADLSRRMTNALNQVRQEEPTLTMQGFIARDGLNQVLDQLINRYALSDFARRHGLRAGDNLVNSEIMQIPAFRGADGNFSQEVYRQALAQQGLTDGMVRQDLGESLLQRQLLDPLSTSPVMPNKMAKRYAELLKERRAGAIALVPSAVFVPKGEPSDAEIKEFYNKNRNRYIRPERRSLRFASFGIGSLDASVDPTPAEIAARFKRDAAQYAAQEARTLTQLIVPTEDAARSLRDKVLAGQSLDAAARAAGFSTSRIGPVSRQDYASSSSAAVADAVFRADSGTVASPARGALGWHVVRIDQIDRKPARTLAQVTPEIREALLGEKRVAALADLSARVEEQIDQGASLAEIAEELKLKVTTSPPLTADGRVYGDPTRGVPPQLSSTLETAFQMEEGEPQLAEVERGKTFLVFEAVDVTPSAAAPLAEIRDQVKFEWRLSEGARLARAAADRILKRVAGKMTLAEAMAQEKVKLPPPDSVNLSREELVSTNNGQVPPPLALMFSMASGTAKKLEGPSDAGWFVVDLDTISTDPIADSDPLVASAQQQLRTALGNEYAAQFYAAIRKELGVERNEAAITAVRKQLTGEN